MKQVEILDLLLKGLYQEKKDDYHSFCMIIQKYNIQVKTIDELSRLAKRLEKDSLIGKPRFTKNDISARLTSYGIDYCEGDSYTYKNSAIIHNNYNISIENSSDTTIVNQSDNVKVEISKSDFKNELMEIVGLIETEIPKDFQQSIIDRINNLIFKL